MGLLAPVPGFNFTVVFLDALPGIGVPLVASFSEVSGLNFETETEEYREGGNNTAPRKFPKWGKYPNLVFKRGVTADPALWGWIEQVLSGPGVPARKNGIVTLSDRGAIAGPIRPPVAAWFFRNGFPEKVQGPSLNAKGNEVAIETLEVVHEGLTRVAPRLWGSDMALQKATLSNVSVYPAVPVEVQFNPTEYGIDSGASYAELQVPGLSGPILQFVRGDATTLSLELFLDGTAERGLPFGPTVEDKLAALRTFVLINGDLHSPPVCRFAWGKIEFQGVITTFKEKYSLFDDAGRILRARVTVSLKKYTVPSVEAKDPKRSSPDRAHVRIVRAGDRIDRIAAEVYGNPRLWRPIAEANELDDPRVLVPGTALRIPAL